MPRVTFVKAAQKDYPKAGIKKGESYYWWKFRFGGKAMSKMAPKASQLTQSPFLSTIYGIGEQMEQLTAGDTLESQVEEIISQLEDLKSETEDHLNNMPDSLQQGPTGEMLQNRMDELDSMIDELQGIDYMVDEEEIKQEATDEIEGSLEGELQSESMEDILQEYEDQLGPVNEMQEPAEGECIQDSPEVELQHRKEENEKLRQKAMEHLEELFQEKLQEKNDEILEEVQGISYNGE